MGLSDGEIIAGAPRVVAVTFAEVSDAKMSSMATGGPVSTATEAFEAAEADTAARGPTGAKGFTVSKAEV
jgi:hypothetical protein